MSVAVAAAVAAAFGALLGSFFNVVIWRLPRGESLVRPGSRCLSCERPVRPYDNVPVLSWLVLRGRCRHCGTRIAARYPLVEALTALLFALVPIALGVQGTVWAGLLLVAILVPCTFIDLDHRIIPNAITYPAAPLAVLVIAVFQTDDLVQHLIAGAAAFAFLGIAAFAYPAGMGMGDVKLIGVIGLLLGRDVAVALAVALVAGTVVGLAIMAVKGVAEGRKTAVPFGPFLAGGALVGLYVGDPIVEAYLDAFA